MLLALRQACDALMEEQALASDNKPLSTWNVELATIHQSISRLEELDYGQPLKEEGVPQHWPMPTTPDLDEWATMAGSSAGALLHVRLCYGRDEDDSAYEISYGRMFISTAGLCWIPAAGEELEVGQTLMRWQDIVGLAKGDDSALGVVEDDQMQIRLGTGKVLHLLLAMPRFVPEDLSHLREIWHSYRNSEIVEVGSPSLLKSERGSQRSAFNPRFSRASNADSATPSFVSAIMPDRLPLANGPPDHTVLETFQLPSASLKSIYQALKAEDGGPLRHVLCDGNLLGAFDMGMSQWIKAKGSGTLVRRLRYRVQLPAGAAVVGASTSAVTDIIRINASQSIVVLVSASCTHDVPFVGNKFRVEVHYVFKPGAEGGVIFQLFVHVRWLEDLSYFCPVSKDSVAEQTETKMRKVAQSLARSLEEEAPRKKI